MVEAIYKTLKKSNIKITIYCPPPPPTNTY
jgi:hypothetical protein